MRPKGSSRYCPEWTDHNVSDPGVALIELFAWMTDLLLYRVNQVPDKVYVKLLELIGVRLQPPRAAQAPVTFYLSAPQQGEITIPEGTEVATVQTETSAAVVFTTEADVTIRPATLLDAYTSRPGADAATITHAPRRLAQRESWINVFPEQPAPDDAFELALRGDHSHHVLDLALVCERASGVAVDPTRPPLQWEAWQGAATGWAACALEQDETGGFNRAGVIRLRTTVMAEGEFHGQRAYWLRCRLTEAQAGAGGYQSSPRLETLRVESRGGTTAARHASTVYDEVLGYSDGTPGQRFMLRRTPILPRDPQRDYLTIESRDGAAQRWEEVDDFADSGPMLPHYTLDSMDGALALGPSLPQPDGAVLLFGAVPARGSLLRFSRYQHGGGLGGNVPSHALTMLKSSIPYVGGVTNWVAAGGGEDAQSLEDAKLRAPRELRTRTRAVTADDYEHLAQQVAGVARARCIGPGAQPGDPGDPQPGHVFVIALPRLSNAHGPIERERLELPAETRAAVDRALDARRLVGSALEVRGPQYVVVSVSATVRLAVRARSPLEAEVCRQVERALYDYLNPYVGGPRHDGWPFGRGLHPAEIFGVLQRHPLVEFVEDVRIAVDEPVNRSVARLDAPLAVPSYAVVCSGRHTVSVA